MQIVPFSRRSLLLAFGAAALGATGVSTSRAATPFTRIRAVKIDTKPLAANGDTFSAAVIAETAPAWVPQYFGPYLAPGDSSAPTLTIRYSLISFGIPGSANSPNGNGAMDYVEGEGVLIGRGRPHARDLPDNHRAVHEGR